MTVSLEEIESFHSSAGMAALREGHAAGRLCSELRWRKGVARRPESGSGIGLTKARTFFVGGNFKMNGTLESVKKNVQTLVSAELDPKAEVVIAPSYPYLVWTREHLGNKNVAVAAQNSWYTGNGAYTGEVSIEQIKDSGASWVILGHSERRAKCLETSDLISQKTKYALDNGVSVILCVGESLEERKAEKTLDVVFSQLAPVVKALTNEDWKRVVIAYEPVWAIGTGLAATPDDAQEIHQQIRKYLGEKINATVADETRIIYGGSVTAKNATSFNDKKDIDGYLVGGASLKPEFVEIINARK